MGGGSILSDVRQDFLISCALHLLIPEDAIERLLGEPAMSTVPAAGKLTVENIIAQCTGQADRIAEFLVELESIDGNGVAICEAVAEVCIHQSDSW